MMGLTGRAGIEGDGPGEGRVNGMTIRQCRCPHCGHVVDIPGPAEDHSDAVIESLRLQIRHLCETIAYLRGSLGWQKTAPGSNRISSR
jgi:hypothetical protein